MKMFERIQIIIGVLSIVFIGLIFGKNVVNNKVDLTLLFLISPPFLITGFLLIKGARKEGLNYYSIVGWGLLGILILLLFFALTMTFS